GGQRDPGRVTIRRLNRVEYNNTIRDLVGIDFHAADDFPSDDVGYGFDNIGDVLSMAPILMEKYLDAAERIVAKAFETPQIRQRIMFRQPTEQTKIDCARQIIERFVLRAYRRPVKSEEVDRLVGLVMEAEVRRMLRNVKAHALVESFAGQWLELRSLKAVTPDTALFPAFDEALRSAMLKESELFFEAMVKEDRSILDFLDADFTFLNERLARHYGVSGVRGDQFQRVHLTSDQRGGILTQASILTVTSNPTH